MSQIERRATASLSLIFAFRMLGMFMILPVFTLYSHNVKGATPTLIGLALGIYGLTQACLQIPFGILADRIGRKTMICLGLLFFMIGSIIAGSATNIYLIILGRAIQGAGAVGSVILTLVADLTREENRTKAMAMIGMTIGFSFSIAMVLGPLVSQWDGLNGIFWLTAIFALLGIFILYFFVPSPINIKSHHDTQTIPKQFISTLKNKDLLRLNFGIFSLHAILTATFIVLPIAFFRYLHIGKSEQWIVYLPILATAFLAMLPAIIIAEKKRQIKSVFLFAIAIVAISQCLFLFSYQNIIPIIVCFFFFMTAFTLLEATLPSLISKIAPAGNKGTAMGIYSTCQFLGIFVGGTLGGWLYGHYQFTGVFLGCGLLAFFWLFITFFMKKPPHLATHLVHFKNLDTLTTHEVTMHLKQFAGVEDVIVIPEEGVAYLKVDNAIVDKDALHQYTTTI